MWDDLILTWGQITSYSQNYYQFTYPTHLFWAVVLYDCFDYSVSVVNKETVHGIKVKVKGPDLC